MDEDVLSNSDLWDKIRSYPTVNHRRIPVPVANSPVAKHVRVAALLSITSNIMVEQVFQPNYLLKQNNDICALLNDMIDEDSIREQHLRAELVALLPHRQKENGKARMEWAISHIASYCAPLVPKGKDEMFLTALEGLCKRAYKGWTELQRVRQRIEPVSQKDDEFEWLLLPLPANASDDRYSNGQHDTRPSSQDGGTGSLLGTSLETAEEAELAEIKVVVWPGFILTDLEDFESISKGLVLSDAQIQAALKEENIAPGIGRHRSMRGVSRRKGSTSEATRSYENGTRNTNNNEKTTAFLREGSGQGPSGS